MKTKTNNNTVQLKAWLFNRPVLFALSFFTLTIIFGLIYTACQTFIHTNSMLALYALFVISFVACTYYVIKKLPHESLNQNDFVAITNGTSIISISASLLTMLTVGIYGSAIQPNILMLYFKHPVLSVVLTILFLLFAMYLVGLAICGIYAKYKRATTIGISKWRVILSMPFGFLLTWTPGYLLKDKNTKNTLAIKSQWYNRFNKQVLSNKNILLFVFLFFLFCKGIIAGLPTVVIYASLLIIYALWYTKHKSDFIKNINQGYALTAVGINIAMLLAILILI